METNVDKLISALRMFKATGRRRTASNLEEHLGWSNDSLRKNVYQARQQNYIITTVKTGKAVEYHLETKGPASVEKIKTLNDVVLSAIRDLDISSFRTPDFHPDVGRDQVPEEVFNACLSDVHAGRKTISYNEEVFLQRLGTWEEALYSILELHRNYAPIKRLNIIIPGDIVDGEEIYRGHGYEVEYGVLEQALLVSKEISGVIQRCSEKFEQVDVLVAPGNHGRGQWKGAARTNWDSVAYILMDALLKQNERVTFYYPNKTKSILLHDIMGHGFLITHGNQVKMWNQLPWYGLTNKAMRWLGSIGKFKYMLTGHFHTSCMGINWNDIQIMANGTFLTDDDWSIEEIGLKGTCSQLFFGVNQKYGKSWSYEIFLDAEEHGVE